MSSVAVPRSQVADERTSAQAWSALPRSGGRAIADVVPAARSRHDIADVTLHDTAGGRSMAGRLRARAFTVGRHIYLGQGAPSASSLAGQHLLRHELGHASLRPRGSGPGHRVPALASAAEERAAERRAHEATPGPGAALAVGEVGGPTGDVVGRDMLSAQRDADQVERLLAGTPNSSTPGQDALDYLGTLTLDDLVDTAVVLDSRGGLEAVAGHLTVGATGDVAGVLLTTIHLSTRGRPSPAWGIAAARAVASLSATTRTSLLTKVLTAMGRGDEVPDLLEGMTALQDSESFRASEGEDVVSPGTPDQTVAGISPGPWAPPGGQPIPFYIGTSAHTAITAFYAASHATDLAFYNYIPISSIVAAATRAGFTLGTASASTTDLALKPDIANLTKAHLYEIKPLAAQALGATEAAVYVAALARAGLTIGLGSTSEPGTAGTVAAPGGWFEFSAPQAGVITYRYRQPRRRRIRVPVPSPRTSPVVSRSFMEEMEAITGLTGAALVTYIIISEGSRFVFPPRNLVPVP
ncbi:hypothetical protein AVL62_13455 [Serinicoccus chungangensis]|uniref:eCIS core domain-containing protein n=1 Tax=Serinicoccus chungangensis TaxID=767452 RepID=A0A0W8IBU3_9MICO|nr:DUF4157 domain-containing protein [Serinicoccus chungangensis]KUG57425.1 hypothetical protein AVL62_13455 [Serinicoccus chungangensis]